MSSVLPLRTYSFLSSLKQSRKVKLLLAVSGGSDSIALLHLITEISNKLNFSICVVTVNHNIREETESRGDAEFVKKLCSNGLKEKVECVVVEIPKGKIEVIADTRKKGIEEAARFIRYRIFEKAKAFFKADYILTAHTKDDFYEGILMSIFSGSTPSSLLGMRMKRGYYLKPLLDIEKNELWAYLLTNGFKWREDSTNYSLDYLRNKVRLSLIPILSQTFSGWRSGLDKTLSKLSIDEKYINTAYNNFIKTIDYWRCDKKNGIYCSNNEFLSMPDSFKIRFLQEGFLLLKVKHRVTYSSIINLSKPYSEGQSVSYNGIMLTIKNGKRLLKLEALTPYKERKTGYMFWVNEKASILIGKFKLRIEERDGKYFVCYEKDEIGPFSLPFCIRSRLQGDTIKVNGREKSVKSILTSYKLSLQEKDMLPIIEVGGVVKALYTGLFGLKNLLSS